MSDLNPCPFCGQKDVTVELFDNNFAATCNNCWARGPGVLYHEKDTFDESLSEWAAKGPLRAADRWNAQQHMPDSIQVTPNKVWSRDGRGRDGTKLLHRVRRTLSSCKPGDHFTVAHNDILKHYKTVNTGRSTFHTAARGLRLNTKTRTIGDDLHIYVTGYRKGHPNKH